MNTKNIKLNKNKKSKTNICELCNTFKNKIISFEDSKTFKQRTLCFNCYKLCDTTLRFKGVNRKR